MNWLSTIGREALALFVDDRRLVLDALIAIVAAAVVVRFGGPALVAAAVLVMGLLTSLGFSVWQRAGKKD